MEVAVRGQSSILLPLLLAIRPPFDAFCWGEQRVELPFALSLSLSLSRSLPNSNPSLLSLEHLAFVTSACVHGSVRFSCTSRQGARVKIERYIAIGKYRGKTLREYIMR